MLTFICLRTVLIVFYRIPVPLSLENLNLIFAVLITSFSHKQLTINVFMTVVEKRETVYSNAAKQFLIHAPPAVLTLHLKRFEQVFLR